MTLVAPGWRPIRQAVAVAAIAVVALVAILALKPALCSNAASILLLRASATPSVLDGATAQRVIDACSPSIAGSPGWQVDAVRWLQQGGDATGATLPAASLFSTLSPLRQRFVMDYLLTFAAKVVATDPGLASRAIALAQGLGHDSPTGYLALGKSWLALASGDPAAEHRAMEAFRLASNTTLAGYAPMVARSEARHWLGRLELEEGNIAAGQEAFRLTVMEDPTDLSGGYTWMAYVYWIDSLRAEKRWDEIDPLVDAAAALGNALHRRSIVEMRRADAYAEQGLHERAVEVLRAVVAEDPQYAPARIALGSRLAAIGDVAGAREEYQAALELEPENAAVKAALAGLAN